MRIAYANVSYKENDSRGKKAHIRQFVDNTIAIGHELWFWSGDAYQGVHKMPASRIERLWTLRQMDVIYIRVEGHPPGVCRYGLTPYKQLLGSPMVVWEFNTVPEFQRVMGSSEKYIQQAVQNFKRYSHGCDLAVCVSQSISDYVQSKLGIKKVLTVPNGSDPDLFRPDVSPVRRLARQSMQLNVVWIGSAELSWHNFDLMSDAARLIWERGEGSRIAFHIIGQQFGHMREMPPNVHYYGADNYGAIPHWLSPMDVGLCLYKPGPADYNSPLKLYDYMASGLAVVATKQPQINKIFGQLGQTDLIVPPDDPGMLADVLLLLEADRERTRKLGKAGRQLVIDHYNWRRAVKNIFNEIEALREERLQTN